MTSIIQHPQRIWIFLSCFIKGNAFAEILRWNPVNNKTTNVQSYEENRGVLSPSTAILPTLWSRQPDKKQSKMKVSRAVENFIGTR